MSQSALDLYFDQPELLSTLADTEFFSICRQAEEELDFMFVKGIPDPLLGRSFPGSERHRFAVRIIEGEDDGRIVLVEDFPKAWLLFGRAIVDEHLTRTFAKIADSILADMMVRHKLYVDLWQSFGEYAVFSNQLRIRKNRKLPTFEHEKEGNFDVVNSSEVEQFRSEFAMMIAHGEVEPLSTKEIIDRGIILFGKRYECNFSAPINGLAQRFQSHLVFLANETISPATPYQFILGYGKISSFSLDKEIEARVGISPQAVHIERLVASSPALAPDMMGWTPH